MPSVVPATPRAQVKADAEAKAGRSFGTYDVVSFSTQVVAGTNYMLKVYAGGPLFPFLIHQPLARQKKGKGR